MSDLLLLDGDYEGVLKNRERVMELEDKEGLLSALHLFAPGILRQQLGVLGEEVEHVVAHILEIPLVQGDAEEGGGDALRHGGQVVGVVPVESGLPGVPGEVRLPPEEILLEDELSVFYDQDTMGKMVAAI